MGANINENKFSISRYVTCGTLTRKVFPKVYRSILFQFRENGFISTSETFHGLYVKLKGIKMRKFRGNFTWKISFVKTGEKWEKWGK